MFKWDREAKLAGHRLKVSLMHGDDWLTLDYCDLARLVKVIHRTSSIDWLLTTSYPENFQPEMMAAWADDESARKPIDMWLHGYIPNNAWVGFKGNWLNHLKIGALTRIPASIRYVIIGNLSGKHKIDTLKFDVMKWPWTPKQVRWVVLEDDVDARVDVPSGTMVFNRKNGPMEIPI